MMYRDEYFQRANGEWPGLSWKSSLPQNLQVKIDVKSEKLREYGLELLNTKMLETIKGNDDDLYELKGGRCRLAVYYDRQRSTFIYLNGWLKKKQRQTKDIADARVLLHEYLNIKGEGIG